MSNHRVFLFGLILALAAVASPQQPSDPPSSSAPTYKLEGHVVPSGDWIQIHAPQIVDSTGKALSTSFSFDVKSGSFAFRSLSAGEHILRVSGMNQQNQVIYTTRKLVVASDLTDVELALRPGASIPIMVRKEGVPPPERCWWMNPFHGADCSDYSAARVELVPVDSLVRVPYNSRPGIVKDPSHFTMDGIEPGKYVVRVELPSFPANYVQSLRSGNLDLFHEQLNVPEYGSVLPIEIVLRDDFAFIKVHANGANREPVIVLLREDVLLPAPQIPTLFREVDSSFPLAPGSYALLAFQYREGLVYSDPEFLSKYAARSINVRVSANETRTVNIDVIHVEE